MTFLLFDPVLFQIWTFHHRNFDVLTFRSYVISTFGHFTISRFDLWTFRNNVIPNLWHFRFYVIWNKYYFDRWHFNMSNFDLLTVRTYVMSTFETFVLGNIYSQTFQFCVISTFALFFPLLFLPWGISPSVISNFRHFDLWNFLSL